MLLPDGQLRVTPLPICWSLPRIRSLPVPLRYGGLQGDIHRHFLIPHPRKREMIQIKRGRVPEVHVPSRGRYFAAGFLASLAFFLTFFLNSDPTSSSMAI